jgi:hypothetical protein
MNQSLAIQFDPTGRYLLIPTIIGIKVIEWSTNKIRKVIMLQHYGFWVDACFWGMRR